MLMPSTGRLTNGGGATSGSAAVAGAHNMIGTTCPVAGRRFYLRQMNRRNGGGGGGGGGGKGESGRVLVTETGAVSAGPNLERERERGCGSLTYGGSEKGNPLQQVPKEIEEEGRRSSASEPGHDAACPVSAIGEAFRCQKNREREREKEGDRQMRTWVPVGRPSSGPGRRLAMFKGGAATAVASGSVERRG